MAKNSESIDVMQHVEMLKEIGVSANEAGDQMTEGLRRIASAGDGISKGVGDLPVKIDIDVSEALKGLKAVQREAKKTARALREVEGMSPEDANLRFTDDEIFEVLSSRGWEIETALLSDGFDNPNMSSVNMYKNHKEN